jgi:uncharacterized protein YecE (DUF72 family)
MMEKMLIGTSGYDYNEWRDVFYPRDLEKKAFLEYYAGTFRTVELNFTYYRMPTAEQLDEMIKRAGNLDFAVKANETMTHKIDPDSWKTSVKEYRTALSPLERTGQLGAVLLQFPYSFHYEPENRKYLDNLLREMNGLPVVVEFRNGKWQNTRVFDALRERKVSFCIMDMPDLNGLPQTSDVVTSDMVYIRFHGRNDAAWWGSDAAERYNYMYTEAELENWKSRIICLMGQAKIIRIYFNNHRKAQAVMNAKMLLELMKK